MNSVRPWGGDVAPAGGGGSDVAPAGGGGAMLPLLGVGGEKEMP